VEVSAGRQNSGVDGPYPGGSNFVSGEFSTPTGWLNKPLY